jgi:hypothetical protein
MPVAQRILFQFSPTPFLALLALLLPVTLMAQQQVYRSVDADGNVTFSAEPPMGADVRSVDRISLPPGPSEAARAEAEERARAIQQAADEYEKQRMAAREAAAKAAKESTAATPPAQVEQSDAGEQWNELLVNERGLTPEQRVKIEEAKRQLHEAQGNGGKPAEGDLYRRAEGDAGGRGGRE